ncbi:MAG: hrpB [Hydrocarboniphaga sp.]|uniref:ATP-dependent helicase HrpB n=1 Tax=Hydrocarboniphaga sp. TaxID=2033016 RepID=UPI002604947A|nr:ATP-dependent helicase HrpB [Hydrocarboniphaga sp.]MDB5967769.1 hrpB [Hydrocarboniphaga sp.]
MRALPALPALEAVPALRLALRDAGCAVLAAPPGSGKTTLVPLVLLDEPWLAGKRILILEPRRLAARASAARMASLLGEPVGETVGYQVRFERRIGPNTRIEVITEGLLARRLQADADLPGVGLVIFDEFHERSLDADLALALCWDARMSLRPDLRLLVMSATLDTARVSRLLDEAPVVEAGGRLFPVELRYRPPRAGDDLESAMVGGVLAGLAETPGDVLAFLPGGREIRGVQRRLESRLPGNVEVRPLYGELDSREQDLALAPVPAGRRKVILATNIAQTSLTVEGVTTVVDAGYARVARYDLGSGANALQTERISRASAEQRAGRAGRLGPGVCYRLWSNENQGRMPAFDDPEILTADISRFALELASWGTGPSALRLLDQPPVIAWQAARELLLALGAIGSDGRITRHGRELVRLPASPRRGHMLVGARALGLEAVAAWTAAVLDERDGSSQLDLAHTVRGYVLGRAADVGAQRRVREVVRQLLRQRDVHASEISADFDEDDVGRVLALAYPERIARRRDSGRGLYLCADGSEARLPENDPLAQQTWLAIGNWDPGPPRKVRAAARLVEARLLKDQAEALGWQGVVRWDPVTGTVLAEERRSLGAIVLERRPLRADPDALAAAMLAGVSALGIAALPWLEAARQWQARVLSLRRWRAEDAWPDVSDEALAATLHGWLRPHLAGITRCDHLERLDLSSILNGGLSYERQQRLAQLAPTHLAVPSGSRIALEYSAEGAPPVLAVKLQELFGLSKTPAVDEGRMPVMLHLLSPGKRPIQVTQDLAGFWERTYAEVRKELKGRYPRHPWPDDPLQAPPTARAKPRQW